VELFHNVFHMALGDLKLLAAKVFSEIIRLMLSVCLLLRSGDDIHFSTNIKYKALLRELQGP
jgi:hypothetical protein